MRRRLQQGRLQQERLLQLHRRRVPTSSTRLNAIQFEVETTAGRLQITRSGLPANFCLWTGVKLGSCAGFAQSLGPTKSIKARLDATTH